MYALVVTESMFGNTRAIADAVAEGLGGELRLRDPGARVEVLDVTQAPSVLPPALVLLVLGGPTHAFSMSRAMTRADALKESPDASRQATGIREWIDGLASAPDLLVVTFDTRVKKPFVPGSAAKSAARELRDHGFGHAERGETFWVADTPGPLLPGETDRAARWGASLAARL